MHSFEQTADSTPLLTPALQAQLLTLARAAIDAGLNGGDPLRLKVEDYSPSLSEPAACFVTLTRNGALRGCIGTLEARESLVEAVAYYAYQAAFGDPRFPVLEADELKLLRIEISVLGPQQLLNVASEEQLLDLLRPGRDGLIIKEGALQATFLPQVWEVLPNPQAFVRALKCKAGLAPDYWSAETQCFRYQVESFSEP
jgi:AmmeMemoRadiSam system protein A